MKVFVILAFAILAGGLGFRYTLNNPQSIPSYGFHLFGFEYFEPTYVKRSAGGTWVFL